MLALLGTVALAASLAVSDADVVVRRSLGTDDPHPAVVRDGDRVSFDEGWVLLILPDHRRFDVYLEPDWTTTVALDDGAPVFSGDGADALALQVDARTWANDAPDPTLGNAPRLAARLRKRVAKRGRDLDPAVRQRAVDIGLGVLATRLAGGSVSAMFEDEAWYRKAAEAFAWTPSIRQVPAFRWFGWSYGRQAGGVGKFGAVAAVDRIVARTDETGRDVGVYGAMSWAIESADTAEELAALGPALDRWAEVAVVDDLIPVLRAHAEAKQAVGPGRPAPLFSARALDGSDVRSDSFTGQVTVIDFWGTWCGPCLTAIPELQALREAHGDRVRFVALAQEEPGSAARWKATIERHAWADGFLHLYSEDPAIHGLFRVERYPTYAAIDTDGRILSATLSYEELEALLSEI